MKKNIENKTPSLLLLIVLVGFPQISETIFSPSLPTIAEAFKTSISTTFGWGSLQPKPENNPQAVNLGGLFSFMRESKQRQ